MLVYKFENREVRVRRKAMFFEKVIGRDGLKNYHPRVRVLKSIRKENLFE